METLSLMNLLFGVLLNGGVIFHDVEPTRIVKAGEYRMEVIEISSEQVQFNIQYSLKMQWFAPVGDQTGTLSQILPYEYSREEGYLNLEAAGSSTFDNVTLHHLGREDRPDFPNSHHIRVIRKDNKWEADAWYHPGISSTGWSRMHLTLKNLPVLGDYTLHSNLRRSE